MRTETNYDQASRYLTKEPRASLLYWLLEATEQQLSFAGFGDPVLKVPDAPERICDVLARFKDQSCNGYPCAALTEFELTPDPDMFGRLLIAGGLVFIHVRPTDLPDDRYDLIGIVVNLTGKGKTAHDMVVRNSRWTLIPREINMCELDAKKILEDIVAERAPRVLLAFIPLMQNGSDDTIMSSWAVIVRNETDPKKRGDYTLAVVFAQAVGQRDEWQTLVEGITVVDTPLVAEWKAKSREEGLKEGKVEGKVEAKLETLRGFLAKFGSLPEDLAAKLAATRNPVELEDWIQKAAKAKTLASFRKQTKL